MKKITSFTSHLAAEGQRLNYTYSTIEDGKITESNVRKTLVLDESETEVIDAIQVINNYLASKLS